MVIISSDLIILVGQRKVESKFIINNRFLFIRRDDHYTSDNCLVTEIRSPNEKIKYVKYGITVKQMLKTFKKL